MSLDISPSLTLQRIYVSELFLRVMPTPAQTAGRVGSPPRSVICSVGSDHFHSTEREHAFRGQTLLTLTHVM